MAEDCAACKAMAIARAVRSSEHDHGGVPLSEVAPYTPPVIIETPLQKPWWESKTLWLNIPIFLVMVLTAVEVGDVIPDHAAPFVGAIVAVINIALRVWFTDTNLTLKKKEEA